MRSTTFIIILVVFFIALLSIAFLQLRDREEVRTYTPTELDANLTSLQNQLNSVQNKFNSQKIQIEELEATQEANVISIVDLTKAQTEERESDYRDSDLPDGCPSNSDLDRWFERMNDGYITLRQYDRILDRWNECH